MSDLPPPASTSLRGGGDLPGLDPTRPAGDAPAPRFSARAGGRSRRRHAGYLFLLPYLALFAAFLVFPLFYGFWLSLTNHEILSPEPPRFIALANYREAAGDAYFRMAMWTTGRFVAFTVPLTVGFALLLALAIDAIPERRQWIHRLLIFLPAMITVSVTGLVWRWFYHGELGLFNSLLRPLGVSVPWITEPGWAMASIVLMTVWWTLGAPMVILLAGLKQIPAVYHEAAALDGATGTRRFFSITLPLLSPVLLFVVVINIIASFQVFGQTFMITRGGPELSTRVAVHYIYETAFNHYRMGYGAAMSWLLFLAIAIFSILQFRFFRER